VAKSLTCAGAGADTVHLIAEANSGKAATFGVIGFAKTIARPVPHHETLANVAEIEKFYVASAWHGRGVAVGLLAGVVDAARARNWQNLWLCVWQHNARALAFYRKHGFRCIDTTQVLVDGIVFDDDVLLKSLKI
jgi:GNAT superfamily N-acetyltransferase